MVRQEPEQVEPGTIRRRYLLLSIPPTKILPAVILAGWVVVAVVGAYAPFSTDYLTSQVLSVRVPWPIECRRAAGGTEVYASP